MKIAVLGSHPASMKLAPFNSVEWEIWACSPQNYTAPRVDAWFEMHSLDRKWVPGNEPYISVLEQHTRVYVSKLDQRLPHAIEYPIDTILSQYPAKHRGFFSSSVAWMMAFAIHQRPTEIGMYGIDMAAGDEYEYQRPGCHYFMGVAEELGIKITVPPQSDIQEVHPLYGYKEHWRQYWKIKAREEELNARFAKAEHKLAEAHDTKMLLQGALQTIQYEKNTFLKPDLEFISKGAKA